MSDRRKAANTVSGISQHRGMTDGLYRVTTRYLCAGFVIYGGRVTWCAPILRKNLDYWRTVARRVGA